MREILFRGKRRINDEWVEGLLVKDRAFYGKPENHAYIVNHECPSGCFGRDAYIEVDPITVGQYSGLKDRNKIKLFEGDVVQARLISEREHERYVVSFIAGAFTFKNHRGISYMIPSLCDICRIGNIHDNPELLKGEQWCSRNCVFPVWFTRC